MKKQVRIFTYASLILATTLGLSSCCGEKKQCKQECNKKEASIPVTTFESATLYSTAKDSDLRLTQTEVKIVEGQNFAPEYFAYIDPLHQFQTIVGIGGAITDASSEVFARLSPEKQEEFVNAYYNKEKGIGYSIIRTPIHSCDFSSSSYTYIADNDSTLSTFDIAHDEQYKLPLLKRAYQTAGDGTPIYVSPWSPPAWMKDNKDMLHGGKLLPECAPIWANYFVKYIQELEKRGFPIWGLTAQNEPQAVQTWESCIFTAQEQRDFIKNHLGPTLHANNMGDKKLIIWDHNRDLMFQYAGVILNDPEAAKYVWGTGFHWYETWRGSPMNFDALRLTKESFPDKEMIFTEGCEEGFTWEKAKGWHLGEKYAYSIMNDLNCGTAAWTDWNILLDEKGGPNHVGNNCLAPVHITPEGDLHYTNAFYYIGHFSKFIQPGAKRLACHSNRQEFWSTAFVNTDGSVAVVVLNLEDREMNYGIILGDKTYESKLAPHSISTLVLK